MTSIHFLWWSFPWNSMTIPVYFWSVIAMLPLTGVAIYMMFDILRDIYNERFHRRNERRRKAEKRRAIDWKEANAIIHLLGISNKYVLVWRRYKVKTEALSKLRDKMDQGEARYQLGRIKELKLSTSQYAMAALLLAAGMDVNTVMENLPKLRAFWRKYESDIDIKLVAHAAQYDIDPSLLDALTSAPDVSAVSHV